jgi:aryl-alcohol dehydrogenase-like predicted oxidoreductase
VPSLLSRVQVIAVATFGQVNGMTVTTDRPAIASGDFTLGEDLTVHRLGFGAMQLTGAGIWGEPADRDECLRVLRRAVELGVDFIDTADSYGPFVAEDLIREALHPYDGVTVATKGGLTRTGPGEWHPVGRPMYLRQCVEMSLRRLGVEQIDLYQLHRIDPDVPAADQIGELKALQDEGKIRHIGLSEVGVEEIEAARQITEIVSVQNLYNLTDRKHEAVLDYCEENQLGFIPWFPLATGKLAGSGGPLDELAAKHNASSSQLALAWLLHRSPVMLPIPGTKSVEHLEDNCAAATIELSADEVEELAAVAG